MPTNTATMLLPKPIDADNAEVALASSIPAAFDTIDLHTHGGGTLGRTLATNAFPSGAVLPAPSISGHPHVTGTAPTIAAGANIGTGGSPAVSVTGHDTAMLVTVTTGHASVGAELAVVTFNAVFTTPIPTISSVGNVPQGVVYLTSVVAGGFRICMVGPASIDTAYQFYVHVVDAG